MKGKETEPPEQLTELQAAAVAAWARGQYRGITGLEIREYEAECLDWHRSNGRNRVDWVATVRNWIRNGQRFQRNRSRIAQQSRPQPKLFESAPARVVELVDRIGRKFPGKPE